MHDNRRRCEPVLLGDVIAEIMDEAWRRYEGNRGDDQTNTAGCACVTGADGYPSAAVPDRAEPSQEGDQ